jgi:hypothetical protein
MFSFIFVLSTTVLPFANEQLQGTLYRFSLFAKEELRADERLIAYRINKPSIVFYSDKPIIHAGGMDELLPLLKRNGRLLVIANADDIGPLENSGLALLDKDRRYGLLEKK